MYTLKLIFLILYLAISLCIFLADTPMRQVSCVVLKRRNKSAENIVEHLIQQMSYQKDHNLSSLADVPLHIEGNQDFYFIL